VSVKLSSLPSSLGIEMDESIELLINEIAIKLSLKRKKTRLYAHQSSVLGRP
jgi:hypothetical protein